MKGGRFCGQTDRFHSDGQSVRRREGERGGEEEEGFLTGCAECCGAFTLYHLGLVGFMVGGVTGCFMCRS